MLEIWSVILVITDILKWYVSIPLTIKLGKYIFWPAFSTSDTLWPSGFSISYTCVLKMDLSLDFLIGRPSLSLKCLITWENPGPLLYFCMASSTLKYVSQYTSRVEYFSASGTLGSFTIFLNPPVSLVHVTGTLTSHLGWVLPHHMWGPPLHWSTG